MTTHKSLSGLKVGLVQFPGSNCDWDCTDALLRHFGIKVQTIWHRETELPKIDALVLPGGFSYGDYLRGGSLAAHSPVMQSVRAFASRGGPIIGICNGFQILTESQLLPGILLKNQSGKFVCRNSVLRVSSGNSHYHQAFADKTLCVPVAHGEGRYYIDEDGLKRLQDRSQILFTYDENPNGSVGNIAGIVSENGRILGMMPHPERCMDELTGGTDGKLIWQAFLAAAL